MKTRALFCTPSPWNDWKENVAKYSSFIGLSPHPAGLTTPIAVRPLLFLDSSQLSILSFTHLSLSLCNLSGLWLYGLPWLYGNSRRLVKLIQTDW